MQAKHIGLASLATLPSVLNYIQIGNCDDHRYVLILFLHLYTIVEQVLCIEVL